MTMETETIDRLFLELSQVTRATTGKELAMRAALADMLLLRRGNRLSITPVDAQHWERVLQMAESAV
jgi:predicted RNA-binding protein with PUA-like domain